LLTVSRSLMNVVNCALWRMAIIWNANKVDCLYLLLVCFLVPFTKLSGHTTLHSKLKRAVVVTFIPRSLHLSRNSFRYSVGSRWDVLIVEQDAEKQGKLSR
jgi:hypothetical protein